MNKEIYEKYARLVLEAGINLQKGQNVRVAAEPVHWEFMLAFERIAYEMGARYVRLDIEHAASAINRSKYQKDEFLGYIPAYLPKTVESYVDERWALVRFDGPEDPEINSQMDQKRNAVNVKAMREVTSSLMEATGAKKCRWNVAALPSAKWAAKVMGGPANEETINKFWQVLIPILRLDQPDPVKAWKDHSKTLEARCKFLNDANLDHVHFTGPDTDLKIYLTAKSFWVGGAMLSEDKKIFFPNLPTEEVFTTPDFSKTHGKVKVTRPVKVLGEAVNGAWFEFDKGQVVNYGAADEKGKALLTQYFEIDPQAKFLGEVALVDVSSPIYKSEKIFDSILYDENAACHIALGSGIAMAVKGGDDMSEEELKKEGCNKSLLHTDFMIGSEEVSVTGYDRNGKPIAVIKNGNFVI